MRIKETTKSLDEMEKHERDTQLKEKKARYVVEKLKSHRLADSMVPALGLVKGFLLSRRGIRSAADFIDISINRNLFMDNGARFRFRKGGSTVIWWLNPQQIYALRDWQRDLKKLYESKSPDKLSAEENKKIAQKYKTQRANLEKEEMKVKETIQEENKKTREEFSEKIENLNKIIEDKKQFHDEEVNKTQSTLNEICDKISGYDWEINNLKHQLRGYNEISFKNYLKQILLT